MSSSVHVNGHVQFDDPWQVVNASGQFQNQCPGQSGHATKVIAFSGGKTASFN